MHKFLRCSGCGGEYPLQPLFEGCPGCGATLEVDYDYAALTSKVFSSTLSTNGIWRYAALLPVEDPAVAVSLGEGATPLVRSRHVGPQHGLQALYLKNETVNPTWAHKDRCQSVMLTKAREFGYRRVVTTSTGNHGASAAAYSTAAGLEACIVLCPPETSSLLLDFIGSFSGTALVSDWNGRAAMAQHLVSEHGWYPATGTGAGPGTNPYGIEGYKSIAYELVEQLGGPPDHVFMAVAGGDSFYGIWKGFREMHHLGHIGQTPRMWACQPAGADVVARTLAEGHTQPIVLEEPHSIAISTREPSTGPFTLQAISESGGGAIVVEDVALLEALSQLGREGMCGEAASALPLACALKSAASGEIRPDERVVCIVTAAGIKWPGMLAEIARPPRTLAPSIPELDRVLTELGLADK